MKLFLSYPSAQHALAERLTLALEAEGHEVFIDRSELKAGESFHQRLREGIQAAEAMVFLVTPDSVRTGSYAMAELSIAQQRWRRPGGHVLPVIATPTPMAALPAYLSAVTVLQPTGDLVAETVAAVAQLAPRSHAWRNGVIGAAAVLTLLAAGGFMLSRQAAQATAQAAAQAEAQAAAEAARLAAEQRLLAQAASARELCFSGGYAVAMAHLNELAGPASPPGKLLDTREDCAMRWLRDMRATPGKQTFGEQVALAQPVLLLGLARAAGNERTADLRAHIGWGEYLRSRDGVSSADPAAHWKRALADDPGNAYAHAMLARQMLERPGRLGEARPHFEAALASGRNRTFVRAMQLNATLGGPPEIVAYAVTVADEMRRAKEPMRADHRDRLWSYAFGSSMLNAQSRAAVLTALPAPNLLATFDALFPQAEVGADRRALWRFNRATLQAQAGDRVAARDGFESVASELRASGQTGRLLDEAQRGYERLRAGASPQAESGQRAPR
jgi:TIR domain